MFLWRERQIELNSIEEVLADLAAGKVVVMLDNEDDETLPLQNIDILARQRQTNPLFAV